MTLIHHYYQTLQNIYKDKLQYIEKLKTTRDILQKELIDLKGQLNSYHDLLTKYHLSDIQSLESFLEKHSKGE